MNNQSDAHKARAFPGKSQKEIMSNYEYQIKNDDNEWVTICAKTYYRRYKTSETRKRHIGSKVWSSVRVPFKQGIAVVKAGINIIYNNE